MKKLALTIMAIISIMIAFTTLSWADCPGGTISQIIYAAQGPPAVVFEDDTQAIPALNPYKLKPGDKAILLQNSLGNYYLVNKVVRDPDAVSWVELRKDITILHFDEGRHKNQGYLDIRPGDIVQIERGCEPAEYEVERVD